jgi:hypothetical protein
VLDVITHTTGGYELPAKEMEEWQYQRNAVNRYFTSLGYSNINVNQKTFCEDAYGREKVSRGPNGENRNKLTTDATARLMMEIVTGKVATRRMQTTRELASPASHLRVFRVSSCGLKLAGLVPLVMTSLTLKHPRA